MFGTILGMIIIGAVIALLVYRAMNGRRVTA